MNGIQTQEVKVVKVRIEKLTGKIVSSKTVVLISEAYFKALIKENLLQDAKEENSLYVITNPSFLLKEYLLAKDLSSLI